ncbi:MAG TPA: hypothetical protein VGB61_08685 [Pyrinomonadaceae bacterium]|jgi:hypothetical protein
MPRFAKRPDCPSSATLQSYGANTLSFLALPGVAAHLAACEFCGAELSLLTGRAHALQSPSVSASESPSGPLTPPPPLPLALRLFAGSALAEMADAACVGSRRAA